MDRWTGGQSGLVAAQLDRQEADLLFSVQTAKLITQQRARLTAELLDRRLVNFWQEL